MESKPRPQVTFTATVSNEYSLDSAVDLLNAKGFTVMRISANTRQLMGKAKDEQTKKEFAHDHITIA